jgi:hypothetical protein
MYQSTSCRFQYTSEQAKAIRETLAQAGFSRKSEWPNLKREITHIVRNAKLQQDRDILYPTQYVGAIKDQRYRFVKALSEAIDALEYMPIETRFKIFSMMPVEGIDPLLVSSLLEKERPALRKLLDPTRFPRVLAAVVQQATASGLLNGVPTTGAPKERAIRLAVRDLWCVFEHATGQDPKAYPSSYGKEEEGFAGPFYDFAKAVLAPTRLVLPNVLGSQIHTAYSEWRKLVRPPARQHNIKTRRNIRTPRQ